MQHTIRWRQEHELPWTARVRMLVGLVCAGLSVWGRGVGSDCKCREVDGRGGGMWGGMWMIATMQTVIVVQVGAMPKLERMEKAVLL